MGLDVHCASISDLDKEAVEAINACSWKLLLLSHDMLEQIQSPEVIKYFFSRSPLVLHFLYNFLKFLIFQL